MQDPEGMGWPHPAPLPKKIRYQDRAILQMLADGLTIVQAAERLGVCDRTVNRVIHDRMGAETAAQAVALAYQQGMLGNGRRLMLVPVA